MREGMLAILAIERPEIYDHNLPAKTCKGERRRVDPMLDPHNLGCLPARSVEADRVRDPFLASSNPERNENERGCGGEMSHSRTSWPFDAGSI